MSDHPRITLDSLHHAERERLNAIRVRAEVALAKRYPQLKPITVRHILNDELLSDPRVFHHVVSGSDRLCCTNRLRVGLPLSPDGLIPRPL